jgi:hypothetical protein
VSRVAVITDIHANLAALEASLDAIEQIGVETVYCGGDLVGYGPHPNALCQLIEERRIPTIIERVPYGAEAVAWEVEAVGLPEEYAEKLVAAACEVRAMSTLSR